MYILVYVDDLLILGDSEVLWNKLLAHLNGNLKGLTIQMGPDVHFLRMLIEVRRSDKGPTVIYASRIGYLRKLIEKYKVTRSFNSPCTLEALELKPSPALPPYSLSAKIMELCYLDDVRPDIKFVISFLTIVAGERKW